MKKTENLTEKTELNGKIIKIDTEIEKMTNKEILSLIAKQIDDVDNMVKSVDHRERILQTQMARLEQKVDDFVTYKEQAKSDWKYVITTFVTVSLFAISLIINLWPKA